MKTGLIKLDEIIELKEGELIVVASRPAIRKNSICIEYVC